MKELFGQTTVNELADSDRLASAVPGQVAAKNILFSKFCTQLKNLFGVNNWSARTYTSSPCIVVSNNQQYILDETLAPLPFNSTDFATELASNIWVALGGGGGGGASIAVDLAVDATVFNGNLAPTDTNVQACLQKFDDYSPLKEYQIETESVTTGLISFSQLEKIVAIPTKYNIDTLTITPSGGGASIPLITTGGVVVALPINLTIGTYAVALTYSAGMSVSSTIIQTQLQ